MLMTCGFLCADIAACELKSGAIYPATFTDRGPDEDIRAAGLMVEWTVCIQFDICLLYCRHPHDL